MKININRSNVTPEGIITKSDKTTEVELPLKCWKTSDISGFNMFINGKGRYLGPNQMFGGPQGGDIVLYDNVKGGDRFFAVITTMTQGWHSRECNVEFLCWQKDMPYRKLEGIKREFTTGAITEKELIYHTEPIIGFDKTIDVCFTLARERIKAFIDAY